MKYSQYFLRTSKESPKDEASTNADLLIRGGFIHKEMAGAYTFLPLGLKVLNNISNIVRDEMSQAGVNEVLMTSLCPSENWKTTGRWDEVDVLYKVPMSDGKEVALSPTHEEIVTPLVQNYLQSPKDFPLGVYQIQTKFRNEPRAKSGILRGREFLMKDAYSFHLTDEDFQTYYENMKDVYHRVYKRLGIGESTHIVAASGGDFSEFSHEFQTISPIGEDTIYQNPETGEYFNEEILTEEQIGTWKSEKAVEVGNIFPLADKFSKSFNFKVDGKNIHMGCYGIGISRVMGVLAELFNDEKGIKWPATISPFTVYLSAIGKDDTVYAKAEALYQDLSSEGVEVLYDDRRDKKVGPGTKFADFELIGIPYQIVISDRLLESDEVEIWNRSTGEKEIIKLDDIKPELFA